MAEAESQQDLLKTASAVAKQVRLKTISLVSSAMHKRRIADDAPPSDVRLGFSASYQKQAGEHLQVEASFMFLATETGSEDDENEGETNDEQPEVRVHASFAVTYELPGLNEFTDDQLRAFSRMNGIYNAWPYWREFLQSMIARMGLPPFTLPVLTARMLEKMNRDQEIDA